MTEKSLLNQGYRKYEGNDIDVFFNAKICEHSGICVKGNPDVFNVKNRPWINPDAAPSDELAALIDKCPSQALQYIIKR